MTAKIDKLIICNPYVKPTEHWRYNREKSKFEKISDRRPAGYLIATPDSQAHDDPGIFCELELVNKIRPRVDDWRANGYPNVTGVTKQLLKFWHDETERDYQFFYCQLEAIETLIWLVEAHDSEKQGLTIPSDEGLFERLLCKMATGTGKTIVMAMLIAWQIINKITYPTDTRFTKRILIMTPGLTVHSRLRVLLPTNEDNYYDQWNIVPDAFDETLNGGIIKIHHWHTLMPDEDAKNSVVKLGKESDGVFAKRILEHDSENIIVINDEAHHAYRWDMKTLGKLKKSELETIERDTRWIEGLDKIHRARNIVKCFDFTATPYRTEGGSISEDQLFGWIVSDFGLSDAIESGLTKTPSMSIHDDSHKFDNLGQLMSRIYHLYRDDEVERDLNRKNAKANEDLPDLVGNAYWLLGKDWIKTKETWDKHGSIIPPVMITVCNTTRTAARVMNSFENEKFLGLKELSDPDFLLHIDSTQMKNAEDEIGDAKSQDLRELVYTVGKKGKPGERIRNIVAVNMLSEGWDARNVTHIMGLRAFASQLLCEQVVGRGLRRSSYDLNADTGLFAEEKVVVFGVPFTFLPHQGDAGTPPPPEIPTTIIEPDPEKIEHEISWPNIERIDYDFTPKLSVDWDKLEPLELRSDNTITVVDTAPVIEGKPHVGLLSLIDLRELNAKIRFQTIVFKATKRVYEGLKQNWKGNKDFLLMQIIKLVGEFIDSGKINVVDVPKDDELRIKATIMFSMQKITGHVCKGIIGDNAKSRKIFLNTKKPRKSTGDMRPWSTKKPVTHNKKSHTNLGVFDFGWEVKA